MLKALGLIRHSPTQKRSYCSDVSSKYTVDTTFDDDSASSTSSTSGTNDEDNYGLPTVYTTPNFQDFRGERTNISSNVVSVPTLLRNTSKILSTLRDEDKQQERSSVGPSNKESSKWWNLNRNTSKLTSVEEAQEEVIFEMDDDEAAIAEDTIKNSGEESACLFPPPTNDTFNFMTPSPFSTPVTRRHQNRRLHSSSLLSVSEDYEEEEISFVPRFEDTLPARQTPTSRGRGVSLHQEHENCYGASPRSPVNNEDFMLSVERSFQHMTFMTPEDFDTLENAKANSLRNQPDAASTVSLSSMVYSMDKKHFANHQNTSSTASSSTKSYKSNVSSHSTEASSVLNTDRYHITSKSNSRLGNLRQRLSSAFRSKSGKKSVSYSLSKGKNGMSKQEQVYAASLLPSKPLLSKNERTLSSSMVRVPRPMMCHHFDRPLSILLLNPVLKIFEIVLVDYFRETTVGDTLSKARAAASDEGLSLQKYVSLCNRDQELAAPMLPVSLLVDTSDSKQDGDLSPSEKRKEMERRLLVAVPAGWSAKECQHLRRVLWMNPRVQRWWRRSNPFCHPDESDTDEDEAMFDPNDFVADQQEVKKQPTLPPRMPRYQRLVNDEEMV